MKKALNIIGDVLLGIIIVFAIVGIIYALTQKKSTNGAAEIFGKSASVVQSDSMNPVIKKGDLVFADSKISYNDLDEMVIDGDRENNPIVFYKTVINKQNVIVVHRIYDRAYDDNGVFRGYRTWGDNTETNTKWDTVEGTDTELLLTAGTYVGLYTGKVPVVGTVIDFLSTTLGFGVCIVLPIFVYLIFQIFRLVKVVMNNKKVEMMEAAANGVQDQAVKDAIIQEYLKKQEEEKAKAEAEALGKAVAEEEKDKI